MKIRTDYVTNSSSSSYIIARHKDCTLDEVKTMLNKHRDRIGNLLADLLDWGVPLDDAVEAAYNSGNTNTAINLAIAELAEELAYSDSRDLDLGDWQVGSAYASNESGELLENVLYSFGYLMSTDHLKLRSVN